MKASLVQSEVIRRLKRLSIAEKLDVAVAAGLSTNTLDYLIYLPNRKSRWNTIARVAVALGGRFMWLGDEVDDTESLIRSYLTSLQGPEILEFAAKHKFSVISVYQFRSGRTKSIGAARAGPILDTLGITCEWE